MDANGTVTLSGGTGRKPATTPAPTDDVALILHTSGSTGRPKRVPLSHANLSISAGNVARSYALSQRRRVVVRDAAVPRARPRGINARDAVHRRHRRRAGEVQSALVLADRAAITTPRGTRRCRRSTSCCSRAPSKGARATRRRREAALHSIVQRVAPASGHARPRGRIRCAGARGVRHDRSGAPDVVESAAAGAAHCRDRSVRGTDVQHQHHGCQAESISPPGERGEVVHSGTERRSPGTRTTPRPTRRRSPTAGSVPAIRDSSTRTATSRSPGASRK